MAKTKVMHIIGDAHQCHGYSKIQMIVSSHGKLFPVELWKDILKPQLYLNIK